jgi:formyltetrahydrofolate deformylase
MEITAIVSNHQTLAYLADWHRIPYHYLKMTTQTKIPQEQRIYQLVKETKTELVVLARYMQILSDALCQALKGRAINIHHSFLPGFKGAKPYHQAHLRGVKLIGATAHYVTPNLDEGPIIEQEVERVDHTHSVDQLIAVGCDIENRVLARAVRYHLERRVFIDGNKTVVLR